MRLFRRRGNNSLDEIRRALSKDPHERSPFYEKLTPEVGQEVELMFGRAGSVVAYYVLQRVDTPDDDVETLAAKSMFADAAAKAEFHLRCQKRNTEAVEEWFSHHCIECWDGFLAKNPSYVADDAQRDVLIADARRLIDQNWEFVMLLATGYAAPSYEIAGREFEILDRVHYDELD